MNSLRKLENCMEEADASGKGWRCPMIKISQVIAPCKVHCFVINFLIIQMQTFMFSTIATSFFLVMIMCAVRHVNTSSYYNSLLQQTTYITLFLFPCANRCRIDFFSLWRLQG